MKKSIFISKNGDLHIATITIEGFRPIEKPDLEKILKDVKSKKIWRCNVCNDIFIGEFPPKICATCHALESYIWINENELKQFIEVFFSNSLKPGLMDLRIPELSRVK